MTDPQRLKEKYAGRIGGVVLGSARADVPSARARRRTLGTLGLTAAATSLPIATTAAGTKAVASVALTAAAKWGGVGVVLGALALGGMRAAPQWLRVEPARPSPRASQHEGPAVADRSITHPVDPDPIPMTAEESERADEKARPSPQASSRGAMSRRASPEHGESGLPETHLADEVPLLDRARSALVTHPERTLELVDDYLRRFPSGELRPEALVLRIDALVRSDRRQEAEALASQFLSRYPRSPHAKKIRTSMGWSDDAR